MSLERGVGRIINFQGLNTMGDKRTLLECLEDPLRHGTQKLVKARVCGGWVFSNVRTHDAPIWLCKGVDMRELSFHTHGFFNL